MDPPGGAASVRKEGEERMKQRCSRGEERGRGEEGERWEEGEQT